MGTVASRSHLVAKRYASALLDLAAQAGLVDKVEKDLQELAAMYKGSADLRALALNPLISKARQAKAMAALADKAGFQTLTKNFLGVLADNRRLPFLTAVLSAFDTELKKRCGVVEAHVETAYELSPARLEELEKVIAQSTGGGSVSLDVQVNEDLLGGLVVTVGSYMVDDSVRRKLERLQRIMSSQTNQNQQLKEVG